MVFWGWFFYICLKLVLVFQTDSLTTEGTKCRGPFTFLMVWVKGFRLKQRQPNCCSLEVNLHIKNKLVPEFFNQSIKTT